MTNNRKSSLGNPGVSASATKHYSGIALAFTRAACMIQNRDARIIELERGAAQDWLMLQVRPSERFADKGLKYELVWVGTKKGKVTVAAPVGYIYCESDGHRLAVCTNERRQVEWPPVAVQQ